MVDTKGSGNCNIWSREGGNTKNMKLYVEELRITQQKGKLVPVIIVILRVGNTKCASEIMGVYNVMTFLNTLRGDQVSMLTHTYPNKLMGKTNWPSVGLITRLTTHYMCGLVSDLMICELK